MVRNLRTFLTHRLPVRIGTLLLLLVFFFLAPWWLFFLAGAIAIAYFPYPFEVLGLFLAYDLLFGTALTFTVPYLFFITGFVIWVLILFFKRISRYGIRF